jgi:CRISP-associated protein Cas1
LNRPAWTLALDLMEELRPVLADRLVLTLVNRKQVTADDFQEFPGGTVSLTEDGRRTVLNAWQERKQQETKHRALDRSLPLGLLPHVQAQLLARALRGDLSTYLPYLHR